MQPSGYSYSDSASVDSIRKEIEGEYRKRILDKVSFTSLTTIQR